MLEGTVGTFEAPPRSPTWLPARYPPRPGGAVRSGSLPYGPRSSRYEHVKHQDRAVIRTRLAMIAIAGVVMVAALAVLVQPATTPTGRAQGPGTPPGMDVAAAPVLGASLSGRTADEVDAALADGRCGEQEGVVARDECWGALFTDVAAMRGVDVALETIHEVGAVHEGIALTCHEWTHFVGRTALKLHPVLDDALSFDDRRCQFGFRHGVMEEYAADASEPEMRAMVGSFCDKTAAPTPDDESAELERGECLHAMGHAASVYSPADVAGAVTLCDEMPDPGDRQACAGGALMEYGNSFITVAEYGEEVEAGPGSSKITSEEARNLCTILPDTYGSECFRRINMFWGPEFDTDFKSMFDRCVAEAGEHAAMCGRSLGEWAHRKASVPSGPDAPRLVAEAIMGFCTAGGTATMQAECLAGAATPRRMNELWANVPEEDWTEVCDLAPVEIRTPCEQAEAEAEGMYTNAGRIGVSP